MIHPFRLFVCLIIFLLSPAASAGLASIREQAKSEPWQALNTLRALEVDPQLKGAKAVLKCHIEMKLGQFPEARKTVRHANEQLKLSNIEQIHLELCAIEAAIGMGHYDRALIRAEQLDPYQKNIPPELKASMLLHIGRAWLAVNQSDEALQYIQDSRFLTYQYELPTIRNSTDFMIARLYSELGSYDRAAELYSLAITQFKQQGDLWDELLARYYLTQSYVRLNQNAAAARQANAIRQLAKTLHTPQSQLLYHLSYIKISMSQHRYDQALEQAKMAKPLVLKLDASTYATSYYLLLADIYQQRHNLEAALTSLESACHLADQLGHFDRYRYRARILQRRSAIFAEQGKFELAYQASKDYNIQLRQRMTLRNDLMSALFKAQYNVEQMMLKNALMKSKEQLEEQNEQKKVIIIISFILFLLFLLVLSRTRIQRLKRDVSRDPLTGCYNRHHFESSKVQIWRHNPQLAVILFDIDHFKVINDNFGHPIGDQALITLAHLFHGSLRDNDALIRFGGEEFLIICKHTDYKDIEMIAERLRQICANYSWSSIAEGLKVTASFGIATRQSQDQNLAQLIRRADAALYQAKTAGRNCVITATPAPMSKPMEQQQ
ncbi:hypothetical protein VST7929_02324 [Vibrio stylophorae]|uniref:diguanylate cyclase n=1 Tax=Vibrio stylophorae TaxID=659351 RepID=A0ABM8ZWL9_9VIBR|nr:GGDEF domain-containing protein [Vibrio stylophorae]CAH0534393.1 hypothetical protein VST7929_02324 [Vibrio stylophorae]